MENLKSDEIIKHINLKIEEFRQEIVQIAKDKKCPFISSILLDARLKFQMHAESGKGIFLDDEVKFL
ncbi:MAG: hypothetical protein IPJ26_11835 [Bacteroidetes bacterium]|jgi:hypothetical protein|nr:hypothetical protein [Bacteroidota bacterium]